MRDTELYRHLLGLVPPWTVGRVDLLVKEPRVDVWAEHEAEVRRLLDEKHPEAEKVILIRHNLNTHGIVSLYEAFAPEDARRLAQRLEIHFTPRHGSWLNLPECELSAFTRQHLSRRVADTSTLTQLADTWQADRNQRHQVVRWRFTTTAARTTLERLYPEYQFS